MYLPQGSPVVDELVRLTSKPYRMPPWVPQDIRARALQKLAGRPFYPGAVTYATFGPVAVTHAVRAHGAEHVVRPHGHYYPVSFRAVNRFGAPDADVRAGLPPEAEAVHMWNSNFSAAFADGLPPGSFAARLHEESLDD
jgi:hypothetical protein